MNAPATRSPSIPVANLSTNDPEIRNSVQSLLASFYTDSQGAERRRQRRYPFPHLIHLAPLAADGKTPAGPPIVVVGKQLSEGGVGFFHPHPLPYRKMLVVMETAEGRRHALAVDLTWCRFTPQGWYESGGRFLRIVAVPSLAPRAMPSDPDYSI